MNNQQPKLRTIFKDVKDNTTTNNIMVHIHKYTEPMKPNIA